MNFMYTKYKIFVLLHMKVSNLISLFFVIDIPIMVQALFIYLFHFFLCLSLIERNKITLAIFTFFQSRWEVEDVMDPTQKRPVWGCYLCCKMSIHILIDVPRYAQMSVIFKNPLKFSRIIPHFQFLDDFLSRVFINIVLLIQRFKCIA